MWVKICANTSLEDALMASELGADAVGFVFAPSVRRVTPEQVRTISAKMPDGVERVGVFGGGTAEEVAEAASLAGLTAVQLHGGYDADFALRVGQLVGTGVQVIQTLHWNVAGESGDQIAAELAEIPAGGRVLVDAKVELTNLGGTGRTFDWEAAREVLAGREEVKLIVAGGLRPENLAEMIAALRPWGVDVASGVEASPGKKDRAKVKAFIENARRA